MPAMQGDFAFEGLGFRVWILGFRVECLYL